MKKVGGGLLVALPCLLQPVGYLRVRHGPAIIKPRFIGL
jgi:hypothetical protein